MNTGDKSGNSVAFNTNRRVAIAQFFDAPGAKHSICQQIAPVTTMKGQVSTAKVDSTYS
jgi:hypothetical protein